MMEVIIVITILFFIFSFIFIVIKYFYFNKNNKELEYKSLKKALLLTSLPQNDTFLGREDELENIYKNLSENKSILLLNGIGGIGKTTLAKEYANRYIGYYDHIAFVEYKSDMIESLISAFKPHFNLQGNTHDELYQDLQIKLANITGKNLLIVDDIKTQNDFNIIKDISSNFELLVTSRNEFDTIHKLKVETLPLDKAKELFLKYYDTKEDIEPLLEYLGFHTLFIKLTAQTLANSSYLTISKLEVDFKSGKFGDTTNNLESKNFNLYLKERFEDNNLSEKEILTLKRLSLFPSTEIEFAKLTEFLCIKEENIQEFDTTLNKLSNIGWLIKDKNTFKLLQIIKEFIVPTYKVRYEECSDIVQFFIDIFYLEAGDNPIERFPYLPYVENFDSVIKDKHEKIATLVNNISQIYKDMGELEKALEYQKKALALKEEILGEKHPGLATGYNNISLIYQDMGELEKALEYQKKALDLKEEILGEKHPSLATSYNNISSIYQDMGELEKALEYQKKALALFEEILGEKHPDLATSYNNISMIYQAMGELENALEYQKKALVLKEEILGKNHPSLAISYANISQIYLQNRDIKNAKSNIDKAVAIYRELFPKGHPNLDVMLNIQKQIENSL